jgi:hypothetical protein
MALLKRQLHHQRLPKGDDIQYFIALNTESRHVFVVHEWSCTVNGRFESGSADIELETFLAERGPAQDKLRELIGTIVKEPSDTAVS